MKLSKLCPKCNKLAQEKSHSNFGNLRIISLECGHAYTEKTEPAKDWESLVAQYGPAHKLRKYQGEAYEFARASGFRCIVADEPGVGKTLIPLACIHYHPEKLTPALFVVKSALKLQFCKEILRWLGTDFMPDIIESSDHIPSDLNQVTVVTYDILWRIQRKLNDAYDEAEAKLRLKLGLDEFSRIPDSYKSELPDKESPFIKVGFKLLVLDECQQIKNHDSKRTNCVRDIAKTIPHIISTSGTVIKNNASEYFPILNLTRPELFPDRKRFIVNECDSFWNGRTYKVGGIRNVEAWKRKTGDFIIRRTRAQVLPDLPAIDRKFVSCSFASDKMEAAYKKEQKEFEDMYDEMGDNPTSEDFTHILAKMTKLRHLAGINKVPFAVEHVQEFLEGTDRKIIIFAHHKDVNDLMRLSLNQMIGELNTENETNIPDVLTYTSDLDSDARNKVVNDFITSQARVLIASTKAMGEGVDGLQHVCSDIIMLERQWTPADEEQCEARVSRSGSEASSISAEYIISDGTIDEFFTELCEQKRASIGKTLDGIEVQWNQANLMKELAETLARKGGKRWKLK